MGHIQLACWKLVAHFVQLGTMLLFEKMNHFFRQLYCLRLGAHLASVHTLKQNNILQEMVKRKTGASTRTWIGGTNVYDVSKGGCNSP